MPTTYAGVGNPRDFDQVDYGGGTIGKKVDGGWLYDWRKDPYQDVLSDSDVISQRKLQAFRDSNPGMHVAEDDQGAWAQMTGQQGLYANDAQGNNSGAPAAPSTPSQAWNAVPAGPTTTTTTTNANNTPTPPAGLTPSLPVTGTVDAPAADPTTGSIGAATPAARHSALYDMLLQRINQPITPDRNDPTIRGQADAYSANAERAKRTYLADIAEKGGPYQNLTGEERLANEQAGQASGAFEAQLMGREQDARRESIRSDLALYGGLMSDEEKMQLTEELGLLGASNEAQGISNQYALGLASDATNRYGIATSAATSKYGTDSNFDQFMRELGLRQYDTTNKWDYNWAALGSGASPQ